MKKELCPFCSSKLKLVNQYNTSNGKFEMQFVCTGVKNKVRCPFWVNVEAKNKALCVSKVRKGLKWRRERISTEKAELT